MLYLRYLLIGLRGQFRLKWNFWLLALGQLGIALSSLLAALVLLTRFKSLAGYSAMQILLIYGVANASFALMEIFARGFDAFSGILSQGEFDRILLRPRGTVLQVLGARVEPSRIGRLGIGLACLGTAVFRLWPALCAQGPLFLGMRLLCLALMFSGSCAIIFALFVLGASFSFVTMDSLEIIAIFTDGGREMSQYPLAIYPRWMRSFFTFIVPFGCVNYLPLEFVLGRAGSSPWASLLPLVGFAFLSLSFLAWKAGIKRHVSTGS